MTHVTSAQTNRVRPNSRIAQHPDSRVCIDSPVALFLPCVFILFAWRAFSPIVCLLLALRALRNARTQQQKMLCWAPSSPRHHRSLWVALICIIESSRLDQFESSSHFPWREVDDVHISMAKSASCATQKHTESRGSYVKLTDVSGLTPIKCIVIAKQAN
jgi:hypothetical protein